MSRYPLAAAALLTLAAPPALTAQQVRVTGTTRLEMFDVRPLVDDSIPITAAIGSGLLRHAPDGYVVRCVGGDTICRYRRMGARTAALPVLQDVSIAAWGLGRGVRLFARARGRAVLSGAEDLWPRGGDRADLMAAYAELDRATVRVRVGRQWKASGLGYFDFDGAALLVRPRAGLAVEAYGGWGLARGLHEPITSGDVAIQEPFAPLVRPYVLGAQVTVGTRRWGALAAQYHREIRTDLGGLYVERAGLDGMLRLGATMIDGDLNINIATGAVNEARVNLRLPPIRHVTASAFVRHHRPFFELWTIWDAFSPVGFDEAGLRGRWRGPGGASIEGWTAARRYEDAGAQPLFGRVRTTGWRLGLAGTTRLAVGWAARGHYQAEIGYGAARSDGSVRLERAIGTDASLAISVGAFQRLYELREDEGTVWVLGTDGGLPLGTRTRLTANLSLYRHVAPGTRTDADWTQLRGAVAFAWVLGSEPSLGRVWGTP